MKKQGKLRTQRVLRNACIVGVFIGAVTAQCAGDDISKKFDASLYVMDVLNAGDLYFSMRAFDNGYQELNPVLRMARTDTAFVLSKVTLSVLNHIGLKWMYKKNRTVAWCMSIAANIALSYVVYKNWRLQ